jgi:hypothetical protein
VCVCVGGGSVGLGRGMYIRWEPWRHDTNRGSHASRRPAPCPEPAVGIRLVEAIPVHLDLCRQLVPRLVARRVTGANWRNRGFKLDLWHRGGGAAAACLAWLGRYMNTFTPEGSGWGFEVSTSKVPTPTSTPRWQRIRGLWCREYVGGPPYPCIHHPKVGRRWGVSPTPLPQTHFLAPVPMYSLPQKWGLGLGWGAYPPPQTHFGRGLPCIDLPETGPKSEVDVRAVKEILVVDGCG